MTVYINTTGCTNNKDSRSNITLTRVLVLSAGLRLEVGEGLHFMALTLQVLFSESGLVVAWRRYPFAWQVFLDFSYMHAS